MVKVAISNTRNSDTSNDDVPVCVEASLKENSNH